MGERVDMTIDVDTRHWMKNEISSVKCHRHFRLATWALIIAVGRDGIPTTVRSYS